MEPMELELTTDRGPGALAPIQQIDMQALMLAGLAGGATVETMERLAALCEHMQTRAAEMQFASAMARFQARCPSIPKTAKAKFATRTGIAVEYCYAPLEEIVQVAGPHLAAEGLSYTWDGEFKEEFVKQTCTLRHVGGHSRTASFASSIDRRNSALGPEQQTAKTATFCCRQSLIYVAGLTSCEIDKDGERDSPPITADQAGEIAALIDEVGADEARFLTWIGVAKIGEIRAADYSRAVRALEAKRGAR